LISTTPSELRAFDARCRGDVALIEGMKKHVTQALGRLDGDSPAIQGLRTGWESDFRPALDKLGLALVDLGRAAARLADTYESAASPSPGP
jgi:hypothetical protein